CVCRSAAATPAPLTAAMTAAICVETERSVALAVSPRACTPKVHVEMSGAAMALPLPVTVIDAGVVSAAPAGSASTAATAASATAKRILLIGLLLVGFRGRYVAGPRRRHAGQSSST